MKPALVTGASGFLGWHVARVLRERGYHVRALVRPGSRVEGLDLEIVTGDLRDAASLEQLAHYHTDAFLLDAYSAKGLGGTGETFNWDLAIEAKKLGRPVFLAGGLTPENVAAAVKQVRPFGVDVSSGVETSPGKKDHAKVRAFIAAVRSADSPSS